MVFQKLSILFLWTKVDSALKRLRGVVTFNRYNLQSYIMQNIAFVSRKFYLKSASKHMYSNQTYQDPLRMNDYLLMVNVPALS